jgi:hypothetical protein
MHIDMYIHGLESEHEYGRVHVLAHLHLHNEHEHEYELVHST